MRMKISKQLALLFHDDLVVGLQLGDDTSQHGTTENTLCLRAIRKAAAILGAQLDGLPESDAEA